MCWRANNAFSPARRAEQSGLYQAAVNYGLFASQRAACSTNPASSV